MKNSTVIAVIIFSIVAGCSKEEVTPRNFPRVNTIEATNITSGGATFKAEITFASVPMLDHGFLWSDYALPLFYNSDKISLGSKTGTGSFEAICDRTLQEGKTYYLRAYAISEDHTVFGKIVKFVSLGSKAPVIKDFYPALGTWEDTITVVGENFSELVNKNIVKFNEVSTTVIKASTDTLQVKVPVELAADFSNISISLASNLSTIAKKFQLKGPVSESITPVIGLPDTKVTITGRFLKSVSTKVYFGTTEAPVLSLSSTKIECKVPVMPNGEVQLKIVTGSGGLFASSSFKIQPENLPQLHQIEPASAYIGEIVRLTGDFFAPEIELNVVKFDNTVATIISATKTQIEVIVPLPERRIPAVTVTSYGSSVSLDMFTIQSPEITGFTPLRGGPYSEIIIEGTHLAAGSLQVYLDDEQLDITNIYLDKIHVLVPPKPKKHSGTIKVTFFDQEFVLNEFRFPWIAIQDFPGTNLTNAGCLVHDNMAYLGLAGYPEPSNQFWKFNPAANQWNRLNDFPGPKRERSFSFAVGSKGYFGGGNIDPMVKATDFWEYNFDTDTWHQKTDIPINGYTSLGFALDNEAFVFEQDTDAGLLKLWKYDTSADTWSIKSVSPLNVSGSLYHFIIGNSIYIVQENTLWKYTPATNQWNNLGPTPQYFQYALSVGSFGYGGNYYSCFKYDPTTNSWSEEIPVYFYYVPVVGFSVNGKGYLLGPSLNQYETYTYEFDPDF